MKRRQIFVQYGLGGLLVALNLVAFNCLLSRRPLFRLDLTEDREYSLTSVTRNLVRDLEEDLYIYGYFSERTHPKLASLVPEIEGLAREYGVLSGGKVHVIFTDPRTDEKVAEEAKQRFGVNPVPIVVPGKYENAVINTYFHMVVAYGDQYVRYDPRDLFQVRIEGWEPIVTLGNLEYALTKGIKKVLYGFHSVDALFAELKGNVNVLAWISPQEELPESLREIRGLLEKVCKEMGAKSQGKFRFEIKDPPTERSEQEALFRKYKVGPYSRGLFDRKGYYCGTVLEYGDSVEPLYIAQSENISEASIREAVRTTLTRLVPGFLKTVGVVTPEPDMPPQYMRQQQPPPRDFQVLSQYLRQDYTVKDVNLESGVDADVDMLFVLGPKDLSEEAVYQLDQYLMRGGRVVLALDRYRLDLDALRMGQLAVQEVHNKPLDEWLKGLGITEPMKLVEDDHNAPYIIPHRRRVGGIEIETLRELQYPWFVVAAGEGLARDQAVVSRLEGVTFYWASPLQVDEKATKGLEVTPLVRSSGKAWVSASSAVSPPASALESPQRERRWYTLPEETSPQTLAVALAGSFESYYVDHAPPGEKEPEPEKKAESEKKAEPEASPEGDQPGKSFLTKSPETRLVVIGDGELFSERTFQAAGRARFERTAGEFDENLLLAQNLVDWCLLDNDMIKIRSRGASVRPLDLESHSPVWAEALSYLVPGVIVILLGLVRLARRRSRKPVVLEPAG